MHGGWSRKQYQFAYFKAYKLQTNKLYEGVYEYQKVFMSY